MTVIQPTRFPGIDVIPVETKQNKLGFRSRRMRYLAVSLLPLTCIYSQVVLNIAGKNRLGQPRRKEDYSFEGQLRRATEECSYIAKQDNDTNRMDLIQRMKDAMNNRKVEEFYQERERDKMKSKEYYNKVEQEVRKQVLDSNTPPPFLRPRENRNRPRGRKRKNRRKNQQRGPGIMEEPFQGVFVSPGDEFQHTIFKRSFKDPPFSQGTFKDHNNCFSRCVFARMELVDSNGFPLESTLRKALEDFIDNKKLRSAKVKKVFKCFDDIKKVAIEDNCIFSNRIFRCMNLDEPERWM